jgi:histone H3/H4
VSVNEFESENADNNNDPNNVHDHDDDIGDDHTGQGDGPGSKFWRKCSSCKKNIDLDTKYYICSVSTCNGLRTGYVFCSVACFERHLPGARHKQAGAIEKVSPRAPARILIQTSTPGALKAHSFSPPTKTPIPREVLIIASRLKDYIAARSEYNTSSSVMDVLSDYVRVLCDRAIDNARAEGRKTVLDRDFDFLKKMS